MLLLVCPMVPLSGHRAGGARPVPGANGMLLAWMTGMATRPATRRIRLLCALFALAAGAGASAGDGSVLRLEAYGPEEGLPQSTVKAMAQDDQGFLWVATQDGLARFDGHGFEVWRGSEGTAGTGQVLASGSIDALAFDPAGQRLWLGSNDAGVEVLHLPTWSRTRYAKSEGLSHTLVTHLALDGAGGAWVGTRAGLDHLPAGATRATPLGGDAEIVGLVPQPGHDAVLALGRDCRLWRAGRAAMEALATLPGVPGECVAMQAGPEGVWAASAHGGLFLLDPASGEVLRHLPPDAMPVASPVSALLRRRDGSLLAGLRDGHVVRVDGPGAVPALLPLDRRLESTIEHLFEDAAGALWIGTYTSGLYYARPLSAVVRAGRTDSGRVDGWPRGSMRAIWRRGDHVLLGSDGQLFERRPGRTAWDSVPAFAGQSVRAIAPAGDGGFWIGTQDGLFHWPGEGAARRLPGLPDTRIDAMLVEGDDGWIGTRGGIARLRDGRIVVDAALAPLARSHVTALLRTDGHLWIATNADGLWLLDPDGPPSRVLRAQLHHSLWSLLADRDALWAGSYSRGVFRIDRRTSAVSSTGQRDGLGNDVAYALLDDAEGRLWISTNNGLSVLDPDTGTVQLLGPRDGLANREYNSSSAFRDADGLLYFGGTRGIDVVDPGGLPRASAAARPVLTTLRTTPLESNGNGSRVVDIVYADGVPLVPRDRMVTVQMTAVDFSAPDAAKLRYRVLGLHHGWVYPDAPRAEFTVTDLPPGRYALEVQAAGRDGRFGEARRLELEMAPPWWRHPLAYAAYALALLALAALVVQRVRAAMRRERRQVELLERTVTERTLQLQLANQRLSRTNAQLSIATRRDPLTRVSNRRDLQDWLGRETAALRERLEADAGGADRLVFLIIDLDNFKRVNDVHGHQAGDEVLVHLADRLRLLCREDDLLVRWGGEEFLLVSRFTRLEDAAALAERIRAAIATRPIRLSRGVALDLTCSIGFAPWPFALDWPALGDWSACLELADRCLYAVKRGTKDGWVGVVPGSAPLPDAIQALLGGAAPDEVGPRTAVVLHSGAAPPDFAR